MKNSQMPKGLPRHFLFLPLLFVLLVSSGARHDGQRNRDITKWQHVLEEPQPAADHLAERDALAKRQEQAAIALLRLGKGQLVWPLLRHSPDPSLRSYLIRDLGSSGVSPDLILQRLEIEPEISARRALILSLGGFNADQIPISKRKPLIARLLTLYRSDPDAGIHAAVDWLLRYGHQGLLDRKLDWQGGALRAIDRELAGQLPTDRNWFVTKQGDTMTVIRGPVEFMMGAPRYEPGRDKSDVEAQHRERIPRSFAVSTREVSVGQFQRFLDANPEIKRRAQAAGPRDPTRSGPVLTRLKLDDDCPQVMMTWFEAAQYCNWLSQQEGLPKEEWCYPPFDEIKEGMQLPSDYLHRTGYRLPTDAEWEYAARAGSTTSRFFGSSEELLPEYAWYTGTTFNERPWPGGQLKPNDFGLFDVYGNVWEWIQVWYRDWGSLGADGVHEDWEDPTLTVSKDYQRPRRGGSYTYEADFLRSAYRNHYIPDERRDSVGFRVARTVR
jgi:formylglycine-generating enzyme required for sulfatase activity